MTQRESTTASFARIAGMEKNKVENGIGAVSAGKFNFEDYHVTEITDLCDAELAVYTCDSETTLRRMYEPKPGVFLAESPTVIARALVAGYEPLSFLIEYGRLAEMVETLGEWMQKVPVYTAELSVLTRLTGYHLTRGVLCAMRRKGLETAEALVSGKSRIAVLENVMNPTNVGAIFRCAAALGIDALLLSAGCSDPLYRRCVRVSMGTVFQVPWTYIDGKAKDGALPAVCMLRAAGFWTVSMALRDESVCIDDSRLVSRERLAVILGTEGEGLLPQTIAASDDVVRIPMSHGVDSLNVAAAAAVAFWELGRINRSGGESDGK